MQVGEERGEEVSNKSSHREGQKNLVCICDSLCMAGVCIVYTEMSCSHSLAASHLSSLQWLPPLLLWFICLSYLSSSLYSRRVSRPFCLCQSSFLRKQAKYTQEDRARSTQSYSQLHRDALFSVCLHSPCSRRMSSVSEVHGRQVFFSLETWRERSNWKSRKKRCTR